MTDHLTFDVDAFLAATDLNSDHRDVVKRLFAVPASENIEWRQVRSLLEALGSVTEEQMIVDLRRMLSNATDVFVRPSEL